MSHDGTSPELVFASQLPCWAVHDHRGYHCYRCWVGYHLEPWMTHCLLAMLPCLLCRLLLHCLHFFCCTGQQQSEAQQCWQAQGRFLLLQPLQLAEWTTRVQGFLLYYPQTGTLTELLSWCHHQLSSWLSLLTGWRRSCWSLLL